MVGKILLGVSLLVMLGVAFTGSLTPIEDTSYSSLNPNRVFTLNKPEGKPTYLKLLDGWRDFRNGS